MAKKNRSRAQQWPTIETIVQLKGDIKDLGEIKKELGEIRKNLKEFLEQMPRPSGNVTKQSKTAGPGKKT